MFEGLPSKSLRNATYEAIITWKSYPHGKYLLLVVEGMALCKQGQFGPRPGVHLSSQHQLFLPQFQPHLQVIHVGICLLCHLQQQSTTFIQVTLKTGGF